mmetsp:Transcript_38148/g.114055  ORF Transcript_38148/g.114055 Transcript_38148/m.114055 type:complete len:788 (-) Transcript_38148:151-2514(-)
MSVVIVVIVVSVVLAPRVDLTVRSEFFSRLEILEIAELVFSPLVVVSSSGGRVPVASDELISNRFDQASLGIVQPRLYVELAVSSECGGATFVVVAVLVGGYHGAGRILLPQSRTGEGVIASTIAGEPRGAVAAPARRGLLLLHPKKVLVLLLRIFPLVTLILVIIAVVSIPPRRRGVREGRRTLPPPVNEILEVHTPAARFARQVRQGGAAGEVGLPSRARGGGGGGVLGFRVARGGGGRFVVVVRVGDAPVVVLARSLHGCFFVVVVVIVLTGIFLSVIAGVVLVLIIFLLLLGRRRFVRLDGPAPPEQSQRRPLQLLVHTLVDILEAAEESRGFVFLSFVVVIALAVAVGVRPILVIFVVRKAHLPPLLRIRGVQILLLGIIDPPYINVHGILVVRDRPHIAQRREQFRILLIQTLPLPRVGVRIGQRQRIRQRSHIRQSEISHAGHVHPLPPAEVRSSDVSVERDGPIAGRILLHVPRRSHILVPIGDEIRVGVPKHQRAEFGPAHVQRQLTHLVLQVLVPHDSRKVKHLGAVVNFGPEAMLEQLFRLAEILGGAKFVEMSKDTHDAGESVDLEHVEEFERLHLESVFGVDAQQDQIGDLGAVEHGGGILRGTFHEGHATSLSDRDRDGPDRIVQVPIGMELDQTPYQRRFADAAGTHDDHARGGSVDLPLSSTILQRHIFLLLTPVQIPLDGPLGTYDVRYAKGAGIVSILQCSLRLFPLGALGRLGSLGFGRFGSGGFVGSVRLIADTGPGRRRGGVWVAHGVFSHPPGTRKPPREDTDCS